MRYCGGYEWLYVHEWFWTQVAIAALFRRLRQVVEGEHSAMSNAAFEEYIYADWWDDEVLA